MAKLYGREWTRPELLEKVGDVAQLGGVRIGELSDGFERGVRVADVRTGGGLNFTVLLDRGMDIGQAEYQGIPLAWLSGASFAHPARHDHEGLGFLRTFGGGLMTGCGLTQTGAPSVDAGEDLGLHGRLSHIPAREVGVDARWLGDEYVMSVSGRMRQFRLFGENLELTRTISARLGDASLRIDDTVENLSAESSPLMVLYHINLGFPLLTPESEIVAVPHEVEPRDEVAAPGLSEWMRFHAPVAGYKEQVFLHHIPAGPDGMAEVALRNPWLKLGVRVRYRTAELPYLAEWKMMGKGAYVLGLEPGNSFVKGRAAEREAGRLQSLGAGESRSFLVEIRVVDER